MKRHVVTVFLILLLLGLTATMSGCIAVIPTAKAQEGQLRTYYIAADEVDWDYLPSYPRLPVMERVGVDHNEMAEAAVFVENGPDRIGHVYRKALYREYTDDTFTELKPRSAEWAHLGALGPVIRGVVGDTIQVVFKNNTRYPASVHVHGLFYNKASEGGPTPMAQRMRPRLMMPCQRGQPTPIPGKYRSAPALAPMIPVR